MSHTHDLFIKWLFIYNLSVLFRTRFLIYFWIRIGIEFLKSSISGSFSITIIFYQLISLLSHFTISSQKEPSYSNTLLRNLLSLISNFITHEFYFPQKTRTQFSRVLCHLITRITFPPFSNKIVLIFFFLRLHQNRLQCLYFWHTPKNSSNLYPLPSFKATFTFLGIYYSSTLLLGTQICLSQLGLL